MAVWAALLLAAPARAEQGNGLYEPFPSVGLGEQANAYFASLGLQIGPQELRRGLLTAPLRPSDGPGGPSRRAGITIGGAGTVIFLVALGTAVVVAETTVHARRRPSAS